METAITTAIETAIASATPATATSTPIPEDVIDEIVANFPGITVSEKVFNGLGLVSNYYFWVFFIFAGIFGLVFGSFLNVVIYRVPEKMSLAHPGSHCTTCGYELQWKDNIPILSYIMLGGKCRKCKSKIAPRYTIVEAANMLLCLLTAWLFGRTNIVLGISAMVAISICICVFFVDLEHMIIPDSFQIALLIPAIVWTIFDTDYVWYHHLIGAVAGGLGFFLIAFIFEKITKKEGLGGGDIKFAFVAGLLLGWQRLILMLLIASISGSIVLFALKKKRGESLETPFAPFLTVGLAIAMLFGKAIIDWYFGILI